MHQPGSGGGLGGLRLAPKDILHADDQLSGEEYCWFYVAGTMLFSIHSVMPADKICS